MCQKDNGLLEIGVKWSPALLELLLFYREFQMMNRQSIVEVMVIMIIKDTKCRLLPRGEEEGR